MSDFQSALKTLIEDLVSRYNIAKVYITEKYKKRESYICGAGKEKFLVPQKIEIDNDYSLFLESNSKLSKEKTDKIVNSVKEIISQYKENDSGSDYYEKNS